MEAKVIRRFRDKTDNEKVYAKNNVYNAGEKRVKELERLGYVIIEVKEQEGEPSILDSSVEDVKASATTELGEEKLKELLAQEKSAKNRKGVKEHLEELLAETEQSPEEGE